MPYRTIQRQVEAIRYRGDNVKEMFAFVQGRGWRWLDCGVVPTWRDGAILFYVEDVLRTLEVGSWLLSDGSVLSDSEFVARYEVANGQ